MKIYYRDYVSYMRILNMFRVSRSSSQFWTLWEVCPSLSVCFSSALTSVLIISPPNLKFGVKLPWWHDSFRSDGTDVLADPFTVSFWRFKPGPWVVDPSELSALVGALQPSILPVVGTFRVSGSCG